MPRKPKKTVSDIYETLKELCFLHENKLLCYKDPIWQTAADLLNE